MPDEVVNPPYEPPYGHADAPPPVPEDPNQDPETKAYLDAFKAPPDPRDPVGDTGTRGAEDYQDAFVKPPDPRDPVDSELTPGDLKPPSSTAPPPASEPPVNVDVPNVSQDSDMLTCTMGNWQGEPTEYAYVWVCAGLEVGDGGSGYPLVQDDVGRVYSCVVTATNAAGSTEAPPSNEVTVEAFTTA